MIDTHIHSMFSPDSEESPHRIVEAAVAKKMSYIAFCDHLDIDYPHPTCAPVTDFRLYFEVLQQLRNSFPQIYIAIGIELGYMETACDMYAKILRDYPFDYVINSVHAYGMHDFWDNEYFVGKDKQEAYDIYLQRVLESLDVDYYYTTVGHLGFVSRNAPYDDNALDYDCHAELIDKILQTIIAKNKILEVNTSVFHSHDRTIPNERVLARYKELGGSLVTFASDAHSCKSVARDYDKAVAMLQALGFKSLTVAKSRKLISLSI